MLETNIPSGLLPAFEGTEEMGRINQYSRKYINSICSYLWRRERELTFIKFIQTIESAGRPRADGYSFIETKRGKAPIKCSEIELIEYSFYLELSQL